MNKILRITAVTVFLVLSPYIQAGDRPNILFFAYDDLRPLIKACNEPEPIKLAQAKSKKKNKPYNEAEVKKTFTGINKDSNGVILRQELSKVGKK